MKQFDHEKLEVYQHSIKFVGRLTGLVGSVKEKKQIVLLSEVLNQLDRASISVVLNIAEGNGRRQMKQPIRFFDDARGSATECAACLDVLLAKGAVERNEIEEGKLLLISIVSMLSKLVQYFENKFAVGEDVGEYGTSQIDDISKLKDETK
jgi:four helix bundle protein